MAVLKVIPEILDLAKVWRAESVTVLVHDNGPGVPLSLDLILEEALEAPPWCAQDTTTAVLYSGGEHAPESDHKCHYYWLEFAAEKLRL